MALSILFKKTEQSCIFKYVIILTDVLKCKTEKKEQPLQTQSAKGAQQARGLFCMCDLGVAHCQAQ